MNMVPKKSICAVQEEYRSSIEDSPDSPVSYSEEHVASCDEGPEIVFWSNAAFRTRISNSNYPNQEEAISPRNSFCRDLADRDSRNASHNKTPIHCFSEKSISVNICRGNLTNISAKRCYKMIKIEAHLKSPAMEQTALPFKSTSHAESNGNYRTLGLNNGTIISEDEMKIKAELEKEIEKALEEEIKDDILVLTQRLAQLHARQKVRKEECEDHASEFNTPLKSYNGALQDSECGSILYPKLPKRSTSPLGLGLSSSCREIKSHALGNEGRGLKSHPEKKFQKDLDWVRSLRSGATLNPPKKPNCSLADHEKLRNVSPKFSRDLFSTEKSRSTSELPLHGKSYAKLSPKDELCSTRNILTAHSAICRKMVRRKGNDAVVEAKPGCQADGKPKENRLLLINMMNKFRASGAYNVGDQSQKGAFSRNQPSLLKGLVRNATNAMEKVRLQ